MKRELFSVYLLMLGGEVVYVGCSKNLEHRLKGHAGKVYTSVISFTVPGKIDALLWERKWVLFFRPKYNWLPRHIIERSDLRYFAETA